MKDRDAFGFEGFIPETINEPEYDGVVCPEVSVQLVGLDGNAFAILGRVIKAMKRAGVDKETRDAFTSEATSGDYDNLLATCMKYVEVT